MDKSVHAEPRVQNGRSLRSRKDIGAEGGRGSSKGAGASLYIFQSGFGARLGRIDQNFFWRAGNHARQNGLVVSSYNDHFRCPCSGGLDLRSISTRAATSARNGRLCRRSSTGRGAERWPVSRRPRGSHRLQILTVLHNQVAPAWNPIYPAAELLADPQQAVRAPHSLLRAFLIGL